MSGKPEKKVAPKKKKQQQPQGKEAAKEKPKEAANVEEEKPEVDLEEKQQDEEDMPFLAESSDEESESEDEGERARARKKKVALAKPLKELKEAKRVAPDVIINMTRKDFGKAASRTYRPVDVRDLEAGPKIDDRVLGEEAVIEVDEFAYAGMDKATITTAFEKLARLNGNDGEKDLIKLFVFYFKRGTLIQERGILKSARENDQRTILRLILQYRIQDRVDAHAETLTISRLTWAYPKLASSVRARLEDKICAAPPLANLPLQFRFPAGASIIPKDREADLAIPFILWSVNFHFVINTKKLGDENRDNPANRTRVLREAAARYANLRNYQPARVIANGDFSAITPEQKGWAAIP